MNDSNAWHYTSNDSGTNLDKIKGRGYQYLLFAGWIDGAVPTEIQQMMDDAMAAEAIPLIHPPTTLPRGFDCFEIDSPQALAALNTETEWYWVDNIYL